MAFATAWMNECQDRFGEKMDVRVRMRLMDGENHIKGNGYQDFSSWSQANGTTSFGGSEIFDGGLTENWLADRYGKTFLKDSGSTASACITKILDEPFKSDNVGFCFFKMGNCYHDEDSVARRNIISIYDVDDNQHHYAGFQFDASGVMTVGTQLESDNYGVVDVGDGWYMGWVYVDGADRGIVGHELQARVYHNNGSTVDGDSVHVFCPVVQFGEKEPTFDCITDTDESNTYAVLGTYKELTDVENVLTVSSVRRERERNFGVMQARDWQVKLTNTTQYFTKKKLIGGWLELQAGFADADLWETVGVGQIESAVLSSDATITINLTDRIRALLDTKTEREAYYKDGEAWASNLIPTSVGDTSQPYENDWDDDDIDEGVLVENSSHAATETIKIEFTSATAFKAIFEDETEQTGFSTTSDALIDSMNGFSNVYRLKLDGWSTDSGAYATGDVFEFSSTAQLSSFYLNPIGMPYYLIKSLFGWKWLNVYDGKYESVIDSSDETDWQTEAGVWSSDRITGYWAKGSSVVDMIQGCLKLCHGSIVCRPDGRLRFYVLGESEPSMTLESEPGHGSDINLLSSVFKDDLKYTAEKVTFRYKTLSGSDASFTAETSSPKFSSAQTEKEFDVRWEVKDTVLESAVNRYLNRFVDARRTYELKTTLAGAVIGLSEAIFLHEVMIDDGNYIVAEVCSVELDTIQNEAKIIAYIDPVAMETYARVGVTLVDDGLGTYSTDPIF